MRHKKKYTVKQWKKFKRFDKKETNGKVYWLDVQEMMCKKYDIILTDHRTKKEKQKAFLRKLNMKNLNKGITTFNKGVSDFGKMMDQMSSELGKNVGGKEKDFSFIIPKDKKKKS